MMQIRKYESTDREMVLTLWEQVFPNWTGHNDPAASLDRKLLVADDLIFVAIDGELVVGTVLAGYDGHRGWIYSLAVSTSHRRRGIGTRLLLRAESALESLGCPKLNLQVRSDNDQVVAFYESLGFAIEQRISMGKRLVE
ncbi:MAG: GNAT family acetyltransferase [Planctomycetota bacterium]